MAAFYYLSALSRVPGREKELLFQLCQGITAAFYKSQQYLLHIIPCVIFLPAHGAVDFKCPSKSEKKQFICLLT